MDICKGCDIFPSYCGIRDAKEEYKCPCTNCIVKMICGEVCDEWANLYDTYNTEGATDELPVS